MSNESTVHAVKLHFSTEVGCCFFPTLEHLISKSPLLVSVFGRDLSLQPAFAFPSVEIISL